MMTKMIAIWVIRCLRPYAQLLRRCELTLRRCEIMTGVKLSHSLSRSRHALRHTTEHQSQSVEAGIRVRPVTNVIMLHFQGNTLHRRALLRR